VFGGYGKVRGGKKKTRIGAGHGLYEGNKFYTKKGGKIPCETCSRRKTVEGCESGVYARPRRGRAQQEGGSRVY